MNEQGPVRACPEGIYRGRMTGARMTDRYGVVLEFGFLIEEELLPDGKTFVPSSHAGERLDLRAAITSNYAKKTEPARYEVDEQSIFQLRAVLGFDASTGAGWNEMFLDGGIRFCACIQPRQYNGNFYPSLKELLDINGQRAVDAEAPDKIAKAVAEARSAKAARVAAQPPAQAAQAQPAAQSESGDIPF